MSFGGGGLKLMSSHVVKGHLRTFAGGLKIFSDVAKAAVWAFSSKIVADTRLLICLRNFAAFIGIYDTMAAAGKHSSFAS